jgi:hypothetical protein
MENSLWVKLPIVSDLFYSCCSSDKTRAQLKVVFVRNWVAACKAAGNFDFCGLSDADILACFRSALQKCDKGASKMSSSSRRDSLDLKQFSRMLLLLSARRLGRSETGIDATNCSNEYVASVADTLVAIGFISDPAVHEHSSATSTSPPPLHANYRSSNFRSPNASYLRNLSSRDDVDAPIQPHYLLSRCSTSHGTPDSRRQAAAGKPMKYLWQPQLFSSNAEVMCSPGPYELPSYMRRDWEVHRLRKSMTGKISMLVGLPPSRGRTARTFSDTPHIGQPQEVWFSSFEFLVCPG